MFTFPKHIKLYLVIAYSFSFLLWFLGWYLADLFGVDILLNNDIYFWDGGRDVLLVSLLFSIATLGPFIGALAVWKESDITLTTKGVRDALFVAGLLGGFFLLFNALGRFIETGQSTHTIGSVLFALVYFALTSGTEEFGWRGVLYSHIKAKSESLWRSALYTGLIWGPWHTPFVLYLFSKQGMPLFGIITSYIGFIGTIILMSYLHGWVNVRGGSTFANYLLHTLHNWLPIPMLFLFTENALAPLASIIGYVATILVLQKWYPSDQYFIYE